MLHPMTKILWADTNPPKVIRSASLYHLGISETVPEQFWVLSWDGSSLVWAEAQRPRVKGFFDQATKWTFEDGEEFITDINLPMPKLNRSLGLTSSHVLQPQAVVGPLFMECIPPISGTIYFGFDRSGLSSNVNFKSIKPYGKRLANVRHAVSKGDGKVAYELSVPVYQNFLLSCGLLYPHAR